MIFQCICQKRSKTTFPIISSTDGYRAVTRRCFVKKVFLKISQNSQEKACTRAYFLIKFVKKETLWQAFSCKFSETFKDTFFNRTPWVASCFCRYLIFKDKSFRAAYIVCYGFRIKPNVNEIKKQATAEYLSMSKVLQKWRKFGLDGIEMEHSFEIG